MKPKSFKDILQEGKKFKKGQKVINSDSGSNGKIVTVSGDGNVANVSWNNGKESEITSDKSSIASGPYKKDYDWELTEDKKKDIKILSKLKNINYTEYMTYLVKIDKEIKPFFGKYESAIQAAINFAKMAQVKKIQILSAE